MGSEASSLKWPEESPLAADAAGRSILPTLFRYRDRYQWKWNLTARVINLYFGTQYTEKELKRMYRQNQSFPHRIV